MEYEKLLLGEPDPTPPPPVDVGTTAQPARKEAAAVEIVEAMLREKGYQRVAAEPPSDDTQKHARRLIAERHQAEPQSVTSASSSSAAPIDNTPPNASEVLMTPRPPRQAPPVEKLAVQSKSKPTPPWHKSRWQVVKAKESTDVAEKQTPTLTTEVTEQPTRRDHGGQSGKRGWPRSENAIWFRDYYTMKAFVRKHGLGLDYVESWLEKHPKPKGSASSST